MKIKLLILISFLFLVVACGQDGYAPLGGYAGNCAYIYNSNLSSSCDLNIAGTVTTFAGTAGGQGTADGTGANARFNDAVAAASDGTSLFIADRFSHTIRKLDLATRIVSTVAGLAGVSGNTDGTGSGARLNIPSSLVMVGNFLYIADALNNSIRRMDTTTNQIITIAGSTTGASGSTDGTGTSATFNTPVSLTTDGTSLYVGEFNFKIRKIVISSGVVTTLAAGIQSPTGIANDGTYLYVTNETQHTITKVSMATGVVTILAGSTGMTGSVDGTGTAALFNNPTGILYNNGKLFVVDTQNYTIRTIDTATAVVTTFAGLTGNSGTTDGTGNTARLSVPLALATDGDILYLSDNYTIRKIQ